MALTVTINSTNRTSVLLYDSLVIEQDSSSYVSTATLTIIDKTAALSFLPKQAVVIADGATVLFAGEIASTETEFVTVNKTAIYWHLECQDYNILLEETIVEYARYGDLEFGDDEIIDDLFTTYRADIESTVFVDQIEATMPEMIWEGKTLRQALTDICAVTGGYYYVDFDLALHYFSAEGTSVAFYLSDAPSGANPKSYESFNIYWDGTQIANNIYVIGNDAVGWEEDPASIVSYGERQAVIVDTDLETEAAIAQRGQAALIRYKDPAFSCRVTTFEGAGLRAGMDIRVVNSSLAFDDTMVIQTMRITLRAGQFLYELDLGRRVLGWLDFERRNEDTREKRWIDPGIPAPDNDLLILGPGCDITATYWKSLRNQSLALTGGFQMLRGVFAETKGLVIQPACVNLITNPTFYVDTTGYAVGGSNTIARSTSQSWFGAASMLCTYQDITTLAYYGITLTTAVYYASCWLYVPNNWDGGDIYLSLAGFTGSSGNVIDKQWTAGDQTGVWVRLVSHNTPVAGDLTGVVGLITSSAPTAGRAIYTDGWQCEIARLTETCVGSMAWCAWTGAANASTSTRVANTTSIAAVDTISAAKGSVSAWVRPRYVWNPSGCMVFCAGNANAEFDAYIDNVGKLQFRINGSARCVSPAAIAVNVDHFLVMEWDAVADTSRIFVDGALVASGTCGGGAPTLGTNLQVGYSSFATGATLCGVMTEFSVFSDWLSPDEVLGLWQYRRQSFDYHATTAPGTYISDGNFRISSAYTGTRIEITNSEIAGYNGATKQFYLSAADGKAYAGGGVVVLDESGVNVIANDTPFSHNAYGFVDETDAILSAVYAHYDTDASLNEIMVSTKEKTSYDCKAWLIGRGYDGQYLEANLVALNTAITRYCGVYADITAGAVEEVHVFATDQLHFYATLDGDANNVGVTLQADNELTYITSVRDSKMDIQPHAVDRARFMQLAAVDYRPKKHPERQVLGLVAEDVEAVYPTMASYIHDAHGRDKDVIKAAPLKLAGYDVQQIPILTLAMVQEHERDLADIQERLEKLEGTV